MKCLILMLQFFTRIPINTEIDIKEDSFGKGIVYFPIVGLVIGSLNAMAYFGFSVLFSGLLPLVMVTLVNLLVTGALHLDGLADTCDGVFSARSKDRMLEIMKDSAIGTNGAIAIFFDLALRIALMSYIGESKIMVVILVTPVISRTALSVLIYLSSKSGKGKGLGSLFIGKLTLKNTVIAILLGAVISTFLIGCSALIILGVNIIFIFSYRKYILSKLEVMTGDTLGAGNELCEILILLIFPLLERYLLK